MCVTQPQTMREFFQAVGNVQDHGPKEYISPNYKKTSNFNHLQNNGQLGTFYAFLKKCVYFCMQWVCNYSSEFHSSICVFVLLQVTEGFWHNVTQRQTPFQVHECKSIFTPRIHFFWCKSVNLFVNLHPFETEKKQRKQRKIQVDSKKFKMCLYELRENVQSACSPDVFGAEAIRVNTGGMWCVLYCPRSQNSMTFNSVLFI